MRFSRSSYLLLYLFLDTLTSTIRTGQPFLEEQIDLANSVTMTLNGLTQIVNCSTQIPDCDSHNPALLDLFISSDASTCSIIAFCPLVNPDHVVLVSIYSKRDDPFHRFTIGTVFMIISGLFHGRISLNSVLLLLLANFVDGFTLEMM